MLATMRNMLLNMLGEHPTSAAQDMCILDWLNARRSVLNDETFRAPEVSDVISRNASSEIDSDAAATVAPTATANLADSLDALTLNSTAQGTLGAATERLKMTVTAELFEALVQLEVHSDAYWRTLSAVQYRLTRKRILISSVRTFDDLISYFEQVEGVLTKDGEVASGDNRSEGTAGESCATLWRRCIGDNVAFSGKDGFAHSGSSARRTPQYDYLKRYRTYVRDATNPLHWPELVN